MAGNDGALWRKRRNGREYGSWHTYAAGKVVNLGSSVLEEAREKARLLMGGAPARKPETGPPAQARAPTPFSSRPSYLRDWAAQGGVSAQAPITPLAPPPLPSAGMSPAIAQALAESLASGATSLHVTAVQLGVRYLNKKRPPDATTRELEDIQKTLEVMLSDLFQNTPIRPWHVLAIHTGAMYLRMAAEGEPLSPPVLSSVKTDAPQNP